MSHRTAQLRIGTSGYQYDHWRGVFYPEDIPREQWFDHYAGEFDCVEINNTFYHLPAASTFDRWREAAAAGFTFVLKYSRYGTHMKKLKDPHGHLKPFLQRARRLAEHLGPILVQLPPHWRADVGRLEAFLEAADSDRRWAVEFRDPSWLNDAVFDVLRQHQAALCIHDLLDDHPREVTADWTYLRFHGAGNGGGYPHQRLSAWAPWIEDQLAAGREVFAFFNNDAQGHAIEDARRLIRYTTG